MIRSIILISAFFFTLALSVLPIPSPVATKISVPSGCDSIRCLPGQCVGTPQGPRCMSSDHSQCDCITKFDSVCCRTPKGLVTKSNSCKCNCVKGASVVHKGRCGLKNDCICAAVVMPVCCRTKVGVVTAGNFCKCGCMGGEVVRDGCELDA